MIAFLTGNKSKLQEVQTLIPGVEGLDIDLPEIQEIDAHKVVAAKLEEAQKHYQGDFIVEDTSLYLDALNGLPGPLIKWFLKTVGNDGLYKIASAFHNTKATAKTIIGYSKGGAGIQFFEGVVEGTIVAPRGTNGFGWDILFQPAGSDKTFAEMSAAEKNEHSMRRLAIEQLKDYLDNTR